MNEGFWNEPDRVEEFAQRDPDHRLVQLVEDYPDPASIRVLDLGCAGGRNTVFLAGRGFDVFALDSARSMVDRTRAELRTRGGMSADEAQRRVLLGTMDDLSRFEDRSVSMVVALGVFQQAQSVSEWQRALREATRVLSPGGRCLVANFGPGTGAIGSDAERVEGTEFVFTGLRYGNACLLTVEQLDGEFARVGLSSEIASVQVVRENEGQRRVTVNALYRKTPPPAE